MPDIRTLLDDVTTRPAHPDPVGAVRARVRQRAARRRAGVAAGATMAVAATGLVATRLPAQGNPAAPAASVTATPGPVLPTKDAGGWRAFSRRARPIMDTDVDRVRRVQAVFANDRDAVLGIDHPVRPNGPVPVVFSAGEDPDEWAARLEEAAGPGGWHADVCPRTAPEYDRVVAEIRAADFPSGDDPIGPPLVAIGWVPPCTVEVEMQSDHPAVEDVSYARARWGADVVLVGNRHGEYHN